MTIVIDYVYDIKYQEFKSVLKIELRLLIKTIFRNPKLYTCPVNRKVNNNNLII